MTARTDLTTPSIILIARLGLIDGVNILPKYARPGACSVNFTVNQNLKFHLEIVMLAKFVYSENEKFCETSAFKVRIFLEGHKILQNLYLTFYSTYRQK